MKYLIIPLFLLNLLFSLKAVGQDFPKDTSYTLDSAFEKYIKDYPEITPVSPTLPGKVEEIRDIIYKDTGKRELVLDVFKPVENQNQRLPAVLMVHGGGWISGDKSLLYFMATHLAEAGFITVALEYRLSPEAKYPSAVYDIKTAIKWMKDNAEEYAINNEKIAVLGTSAGGQLAALAGLTANLKKFEDPQDISKTSTEIHAIVDIDGVLAFIHPASEEGEVALKWLGGNQEEARETWIEASPLTYADKNAPPSLFIGSSKPRFLAGSKEVIQILNENGIYNEIYLFEDAPHSFWLFNPWFEPTLNQVKNFLTVVLKD